MNKRCRIDGIMRIAITCAILSLGLLVALGGCGAGADKKPVPFSQLPLAQQRLIVEKVAPPATSHRDNPYSTPMYYIPVKGYHAGPGSQKTKGTVILDRNRPDIQEQLIKNWAEMGMTSTHFLTYPSAWEKDDPHYLQAVRDYFAISEKYGMVVSFRLAGMEGKAWPLNPMNPDNKLDEYAQWAQRVVQFGKGHVHHYIIGDEINSPAHAEWWTYENYMKAFVPLCQAMKAADPEAKVCMFGMGGADWDYVDGLFKKGYGNYGDGVAANFRDYPSEILHEFVRRVKEKAPQFGVWSNGLHWVATRDTPPYPASDKNPAWVFADDEGQAILIAHRTFKLFDAGWDDAPYYIIVRKWVLPDGTEAPTWYGYYGVMDLVLDKYGNMSIKRHPGWYAYQTIANVFYSQKKTKPAPFKVEFSEEVDFSRAYVRNDYECLLMLWNNPAYEGEDESGKSVTDQYEEEGGFTTGYVIPKERIPNMDKPAKKTTTTITLPIQQYSYPVQVSLFNYQELTDLPYRLENGKLVITDVNVGTAPVIIRLVAEK